MTNVPQNLRDMWADVYRLFDTHYKMPNTAEAWAEFWEKANELRNKHGCPWIMGMILIVSDMIEQRDMF